MSLPVRAVRGDPLERDPESVLRDTRNEFISRQSAHDDYGVVLDDALSAVNAAATETLRSEIRARRGWAEIPTVLWEDPA